MGDLERTMSELSLHVAINSLVFTTTTSNSSSSRDVTGHRQSNSDTGGNMTTSSGYEAGTCWSRDDDVIIRSDDDDDDDDDVRVSWSDSSGSPRRPPVARLYHLVSLFRVFLFRNYQSLISFCIIPSLESASSFISSVLHWWVFFTFTSFQSFQFIFFIIITSTIHNSFSFSL